MPMLLRGRWASGVEARVVSGRDASFRGRRETCSGRLARVADWFAGGLRCGSRAAAVLLGAKPGIASQSVARLETRP